MNIGKHWKTDTMYTVKHIIIYITITFHSTPPPFVLSYYTYLNKKNRIMYSLDGLESTDI